jgi:uncharacterized protein
MIGDAVPIGENRQMTQSVPVTVYYHADCLDGFGAAYAAWRRFGDAARYRPMHHGENWDVADVEGCDVFILDFSFRPDVLTRMADHARSVCQIDHHVSARDDWADRLVSEPGTARSHFRDPSGRLALDFDLDKSGARLAWEHFHPDTPVPLALLHIEDQDLWRFRLPGTRAFCRALRLRSFSFDAWNAVVDAASAPDGPAYLALLAEGEAVDRFISLEVERLAASSLVMPVTLELPDAGSGKLQSVEGLAINANAVFASDLGGRLAERSGTFGLVWYLAADGVVKASLRACNTVNVARIAQFYGGGGHPNAAGFRMPWQEFGVRLRSAGR